jgi:hypothetical protein
MALGKTLFFATAVQREYTYTQVNTLLLLNAGMDLFMSSLIMGFGTGSSLGHVALRSKASNGDDLITWPH